MWSSGPTHLHPADVRVDLVYRLSLYCSLNLKSYVLKKIKRRLKSTSLADTV